MEVNTKYFGILKNISQCQQISFEAGLVGMDTFKRYVIFDLPENDKIKCLQSLEDVNIAFFMIKPWDFFETYEIDVPDFELEKLHIENENEIAIFNIITIPEDQRGITANLLAPVVINAETREAMQYVLQGEKYNTRHPIFSKQGGV